MVEITKKLGYNDLNVEKNEIEETSRNNDYQKEREE